MTDLQDGVPPHFVVIVPGYMGSKLRHRQTKELVWVNISAIPWNPLSWKSWLDHLLKTMEYPNPDLEPAGLMDEIIFVPPWAKLENYERLVKKLQSIGYKADMAQCFGFEAERPPFDESQLNVYAFAYDWRQDNVESARQLRGAVNRWRSFHPDAQVWIIAHSNGGVVARWYIEQEGGKDCVTRLFLLGSPWDGTPKALHMAFNGLDTLFTRKFNLFDIQSRTRKLVRSFPSIYQLIPYQNRFLRDASNNPVSPFTDGVWLNDPRAQRMLAKAEQFSEQLGTKMSVEAICFFGTRRPTPTSGRVTFAAANTWSGIEWDAQADAGDGTIPERSAVHPRAKEKLPYPVSHGDIYVDEAVLEKLRFEMIDKYRLTLRDAVIDSRLRIIFEQESNPDSESGHKDFYNPGQKIKLWATVHQHSPIPPEMAESEGGASAQAEADPLELDEEDWLPVTDASIRVTMRWRQPVPGEQNPEARVEPPKNLSETYLTHSPESPGHYESRMLAPLVEGCYELQAVVSIHGKAPIRLKELIGVEAVPDLSLLGMRELVGAVEDTMGAVEPQADNQQAESK